MPRSAAARAPKAVPQTVASRRGALRAAKGLAKTSGGKTTTEIDLSQPGARKALTALYPKPAWDVMIPATPELEADALAYIEARDAASLATERKEAAGNRLCNAIGKNRGILGDGWKAEWDMSKGNVDWTALARDLNIPDATIAKYRKPESRVLNVRETAEE